MNGPGTLTVRTRRENDEMVRIEICDDGPGIPEDIVDRIFTPFFTTKPFGEGTGLGLDLAWRIVAEKHRGNLQVQSRPATPASSSSSHSSRPRPSRWSDMRAVRG